jgi:polynucleotide 5'-hydroxyl-kinase GRC3/NOL9
LFPATDIAPVLGTILPVNDNLHDVLVERLVREANVIMLIGAPDTGKTTLARQLLAAGIEAERTAAYIDADVGQTMVGPPACVGLKWVRSRQDMEDFSHADDLRFVGSISPERLVLQEVLATATLVAVAREQADFIIIDTTGAVSGVTGQTLKYHKMEMCRPDVVVALQRGSEMEPMVGLLRRFFSAEVELTSVHPDVIPVSPEERRAHRTNWFAETLAPPLNRWRVRPTVFAPALPTGLDLSRLNGMLVGVHDGTGRCLGLGVLEYEDDTLRVLTNVGEGMKGLRLGSIKIELDTFETHSANLREIMFGLDL